MASGSVAGSPEMLAALERASALLRDLLVEHDLVKQPGLTLDDMQGLSAELNEKVHRECPRIDRNVHFRVGAASRCGDWPLGRWHFVIDAERREQVGSLEVGLDMVPGSAE